MLRKIFMTLLGVVILLSGSPPADAARWALLIGVDHYEHAQVFRPLRFAGRDVMNLADVLAASGYDRDHILVMQSGADAAMLQPTHAAIVQQLRAVLTQHAWGPGDSLLVVFAGHGVNIDGTSYLCPANARLQDPAATMLSLAELSTALANSSAGQTFLVIDACREEIQSTADTQFNLLTGLRKLSVGGEGPQGIVYFASCLARQRSIEDEQLQQGVFLHYFAEGLSGLADVQAAGNRDGRVSCHEVFEYVSRKTRQRSRAATGWEQQPWFEGRATAGMSLAELPGERRAALLASAPDEADEYSAAALHSQQELTEALLALQSGDAPTVVSKSLAAIELDPGNRMAYRTASLGYQVQRDYVRAMSVLKPIQEPLDVRLDAPLSVKQGTTILQQAGAGDVLEVKSIQRQPSGDSWALVTAIRRNGSRDPHDAVPVRGFVKLTPKAEDPAQVYLAAAGSADQVREFNRTNYQPAYIAESWQAGGGGAAAALKRWDDIQSTINSIPYAPSIPSIPYLGTIRSIAGW